MRLSRKSEYACLALIGLAEQYGGGAVKTHDLARRKAIPKGFLTQILLRLKNAGYVKSMRGAAGGYRLARPPEKITLAEVIRLMDGALAPVESVSKLFYDPSPVERSEKLTALFREVRDYVAKKLEGVTFADLI
jgi:Rrf2 family protein